MKILGIDPGLNITGFGIIEVTEGNFKCLDFGFVRTSSKNCLSERLLKIHSYIEELLLKFDISEASCESLFIRKNVKSIILMAHARGVIFERLGKNKIKVFEYSPREIKNAVTGNGNASKEQVKFMIRNILHIDDDISYDVSDALAASVAHINKR